MGIIGSKDLSLALEDSAEQKLPVAGFVRGVSKASEKSKILSFSLEDSAEQKLPVASFVRGVCRRRMRVHTKEEQISTLTLNPSPLKGEGQKYKVAFTLAEMMVVMLLLSIVLAAGAPLMTKRTESTSLWRQTPNNTNKIYYSTNDKQQALIGTKNANVTNSKLHIDSSNPNSYPHLTFGVNGAYAGVIKVESTSRMSVKLAASSGNTFALDNSNLYVNGNVDIGQSGTSYKLKLNGSEIKPSSPVPIGTVIIWPSSGSPSEGVWLECDGTAIPAQYTELRSLVGANRPNYKGLFLRGYGTQLLESSWKGSWNNTSNTPYGLGTRQGDRSRQITGDFGYNLWFHRASHASGVFSLKNDAHIGEAISGGGASFWYNSFNFDNARQINTLSFDSFPAHAVVRFLIKAAH